MSSYRFQKITGEAPMASSLEVWGRFAASNVSEAIGAFKYAFKYREEEYTKALFLITKEDGTGWIRRIK